MAGINSRGAASVAVVCMIVYYYFSRDATIGNWFMDRFEHLIHPDAHDHHEADANQVGSRLLFVMGGTGQQGRGFIDEVIKYNAATNGPKYRIRTVSRKSDGEEARELKKLGVEVIRGRFDPTERDHLVHHHLRGAHGMFGMTFSDFKENGTLELESGKFLADIVKEAGVRRFVFSGGEKTGVPFLDVKYHIEEYMRQLNLPYSVYLHTVFFYENLITKKGVKRVKTNDEGVIEVTTPLPADLKIPMISAYDIGRIAARILLSPETVKDGTSIPIAGDVVSCQDFVGAFNHVTGLKAVYSQTPLSVFKSARFEGVDQISEMYEWYLNKSHTRDLSVTKAIYPYVYSLQDWMGFEGANTIKKIIFQEESKKLQKVEEGIDDE